MRDFKRIGGEILSSPLNENFRKLRNDISIANSNLVFSDKYGIMATIQDMKDLKDNPEVELTEGQACYVVSSGELYRYSELDEKWHKIADFGQTFRQSFLNSGVVLVEEPIGVSTDYLVMPRMLVYFKNKPGEDPYLKGMYLIEKQDFNVHPSNLAENMVYSVYVDYTKTYHLIPGLPIEDDPNNIFIGSFMLHNRGLTPELVYTLPDIAYTADRGSFLLNGGQCSGAELYVEANTGVLSRKSGYYYDEGANYPGASYYAYNFNQLENASYTIYIDNNMIGSFSVNTATEVLGEIDYYPEHPDRVVVRQNDLIVATYNVSIGQSSGERLDFLLQQSIDNYPKSLDDSSNYNLKALPGLPTITNLYYTTPHDNIENLDLRSEGTIIYNKFIPSGSSSLVDVRAGCFTIQKHLVTPTGQNIMVYGDTEYESYEDAESHINEPVYLDEEFLYAEVTRVIVENPSTGTFNPERHCSFFTTARLVQVGTINPIFADDEFKIYAHDDVNPTAFLEFNLDTIKSQNVQDYVLKPKSWSYTQYNFRLDDKYIKGSAGNTDVEQITKEETSSHNLDANTKGYIIPSEAQLDTLRGRVGDIETEIWSDYQNAASRYEQSIRYRLYKLENDIYNDYGDQLNSLQINPRLTTAESKIDYAEHYKANKDTTVNWHALGDSSNTYTPQYSVVLYTGDIDEGAGVDRGDGVTRPANQWFTVQRVKDVDWVLAAHNHTLATNNPHNTTTDNIIVNPNSDNLFVTANEKDKLAHVPGASDPNGYTDTQLNDLRNTKISDVQVYRVNNATHAETLLGGIKTLKVNDFGANISVNGTVGTLECVGQADPSSVLYKTEYTPIADATPGKSGYVDKALFADTIDSTGIAAAQYYGSDEDYPTTTVGWHDLPVYVSTGDAESYTNIDSVILQPEEKSVALKHLATSRVVYTSTDEETNLGDNVYNLVKNHYHKVYNSGTQGPYIEDPQHPGTYIQDVSGITYIYKVPYGGLVEHTYYLEYNNINYSFNTTNLGTIPVNTILTYIPSSGNIEITISGTTSTLTTNQVQPSAVDEDYYLEFIAETDWSKINKWNFGDNLTVTVADGTATINAFNASGDTPVHAFINLDDVDFVYNDAQPGQMLVINANGDGIDVSNAPALSSYMLISDYVNSQQPTKVNAAVAADTATTAQSAGTSALLQGMYSVNDNNIDNTSLWTSNKINTTISNKIATEGVRTDYGSDLPTVHTFTFTPKKGDLYILTE